MSEKLISLGDARSDILACAAYIAERLGGSDDRSEAIGAVLPVYLERKNVDLAAELANSVDDPFAGDKLLILVAAKCAEIEDVDYAMQLSEVIQEYGLQSQAREAIAINLARQGKIEQAFEIAGLVIHPDQAFAGIAVNQAEAGDIDSAKETISQIDYPASAVSALITIAGSQIEKKNNESAVELLAKATKIAAEIELDEEKVKSLCDISTSYIGVEDHSEAIHCLKKALDVAEGTESIQRDSLLSFVSSGFMSAGSVESADSTLDLITDKTQIASTLLSFSRHYLAKEQNEDAQEALDEAYEVLKSQHEKETRSSKAKFALFGSIAAQYANMIDGDKAIDVAMSIESEDDSSNALAHIAQILVRQANGELAEVSVTNIPDSSGRMFAYIGMGNAAKQEKQADIASAYYAKALELAEEIPQATLVSAAYSAVATRFVEMEEIDKARETASKGLATVGAIRDGSQKVTALSNFALLFDRADFVLSEADKESLASMIIADQ